MSNIPDGELWAEHNAAKRQMLDLVRERTVKRLMRLDAGPLEVNAAAAVLDPNALTIGFARRFATYKRATLLFRDQERIKRLLHDPARPVQLIFSGKAHPADEPGKAFIQAVCQMSKQPDFAGKIIFVEDYDANIARHLVAGVDVWLNNPRRPLEASGTSGQKAGLNGVPNFSVLDGWWREGYDGHNGWAIGAEREYPNEAAQDEADALSLYSTLENVIVPLFYERDIVTDLPEGWLAMMRASMSTVAPDFSFDRMLKEYVSKFYLPAGVLGRRVDGPSYAGARALAAWEARVRAGWDQVSLTAAGPKQRRDVCGQAVGGAGDLAAWPVETRGPGCGACLRPDGRRRSVRCDCDPHAPAWRRGRGSATVCRSVRFDRERRLHLWRARPAAPHRPAEPLRPGPGEVGVSG